MITVKQLKKIWLTCPLRKLDLVPLDTSFTALPIEKWRKILKESTVDKIPYVAERRDCDNFALALAGEVALKHKASMGVVIDYSGKHAYNCILVDNDGEISVQIVEPQSDKIMRVAGKKYSSSEAYAATYGWVIFA